MRRRSRKDDTPTTSKSLLIFGLLFLIAFSTSVTLTSFPQHLALNDKTVIQTIQFINNNTAMIKGNQVQFVQGDILPLAGRDFIRITGNQVQVGESQYNEGIRTVSASFHQNVLFSQKVGTFKSNQAAQIVVDKTVFNLIPMSKSVISTTVVDLSGKRIENHYNIEFTQDTIYINENEIMLKLVNNDDTITVSLIGVKKYNNIIMRII